MHVWEPKDKEIAYSSVRVSIRILFVSVFVFLLILNLILKRKVNKMAIEESDDSLFKKIVLEFLNRKLSSYTQMFTF